MWPRGFARLTVVMNLGAMEASESGQGNAISLGFRLSLYFLNYTIILSHHSILVRTISLVLLSPPSNILVATHFI